MPGAASESAGQAKPGTKPGAGSDAGAAAERVRVVPGIARYHGSDCILIRFLAEEDLEIMTREDAAAQGCVPCKACNPDKPAAQLPA